MSAGKLFIAADTHDEPCLWLDCGGDYPTLVLPSYQIAPAWRTQVFALLAKALDEGER